VLLQIEKQSSISFSFNPDNLPLEALVTYKESNTSLQKVLTYISNTYHFKFEQIEKQIALLPNPNASPLTFNLSGNINDNQTGESLIGATIRIDNIDLGTISNGYGFYSLPLPYGNHTLQISYLGYEISNDTVTLVSNSTLNISLNQSFPELKEIIVQGYKPPNVELTQTGKISLSPKSIAESPAILGESDAIKSLEKIPGIQLQSEGSTFFYVRGGNKDQNLILIDDAPIYNPSHMLGLFSSIIPETANSIDTYKSDFPLSKGGRLSSVIDIKTKEGNKNRFSGWGNIGLVSTQLGIEGPIKKGKSSYLLSGRLSRIKWFFKKEFPDLDKFQFYDITSKVNFELANRDKLYFSFYTGADRFLASNSGLGWSNYNGSIRWNKIINQNTFVNTTFYGSNYEYLLYINRDKNESWRSRIGEIGFKTDFTHFLDKNQEIAWGLNVNGRTINPGNLNREDTIPEDLIVSVKNNLEIAGYFQHSVKFREKWGLKYGLRASLWTSIGESFEFTFNDDGIATDTLAYITGVPYHTYFQVEPRISISYFINDNSSVKASYDRSTQNLHLITNSISPFTSFEIWLPSGPNIKPQFSNQLALGYYHYLPAIGISLQAESYYKILQNQIDYESHASTLLNPTIESELQFGTTRSQGIEFFAKKEEGRIRGMVGYTLSKARSQFNNINNGKSFTAYADRPHNISLSINYDIARRVTLSSNFIYTTGIPFSTPTSFYLFDGNEIPVYDRKNNSRMPAYHRLDVSARFTLNKNLHKKFRHSIILSVYNLYGRKNPIFINFNKTINDKGKFEVPTNLLTASRLSSQIYIYGIAPSVNYQFRF
jgi:TonB-dependent receptor-like protein/carboxypeptidase-like protein